MGILYYRRHSFFRRASVKASDECKRSTEYDKKRIKRKHF